MRTGEIAALRQRLDRVTAVPQRCVNIGRKLSPDIQNMPVLQLFRQRIGEPLPADRLTG
jgi:hypothetical protein